MKPLKQIWILIATFTVLAVPACVSVNIKPKQPNRSTEYKFREPGRPFEKMNNEPADQAWQDPKTGNTIAVLSECSEQKDPSLTTLESDTIQALNNYQVLQTQESKFQDRASRRSQVEGTVDGIPVKMDVMVFKKNACSYTLTYMGRAKGFDKQLNAFDQFLKGFEVP